MKKLRHFQPTTVFAINRFKSKRNLYIFGKNIFNHLTINSDETELR